MAEDVIVEDAGAAETATPKAAKAATPTSAKPGAPHMVIRIVLGLAGLVLVVGFFLPWVQFADDSRISGLDLVVANDHRIQQTVGETLRWTLLAIPTLGVVLTAVGFLGFRWSGPVGAIVGLTLFGYGAVVVVVVFFQSTGLGLWLIVGGAFVALLSGVIAWTRARNAKRAANVELPVDG